MNLLDPREPFNAWSHALWLLLSIPATLVLWRRGAGDWSKRISLLVFGASLAACSLGSTVFHGVRVEGEDLAFYDRLDHVGIHFLIAGTYTPLAWNLLQGRWKLGTLVSVWGATAISSVLLLSNVRLSGPLATCEYLLFGWAALFCYVEIARILPHRSLRPLLIGGILYTVGAIFNALRWPALWPGVLEHHEIFHVWVIGGSVTHFWFMLTVVVPFTWTSASPRVPSPALARHRIDARERSPGVRPGLFRSRLRSRV